MLAQPQGRVHTIAINHNVRINMLWHMESDRRVTNCGVIAHNSPRNPLVVDLEYVCNRREIGNPYL